jgi:Ca-activated chloride channel family protein
MTFLTPLLAGIAAAVAVPTLLILYFLKLRRRDVEVSTTLLWKQAIQDMQANAPFQRLRRNILLLLQLLALAGALLALAQPEIRGELTPGQELVLIIDRSASMQSTDGSPDDPRARQTRLDRAKAQALEMVDERAGPARQRGRPRDAHRL